MAVAWVLLALLQSPAAQAAQTLSGAGSSAAAPVYRAWAQAYGHKHDVQLQYDAVGSSAGLQKIKTKEVAFGASDVAPADADLQRDHLILAPLFVTGITPVVNLPTIASGKLRLTPEALAGIFLGTITRWNAPAIQGANPSLTLPDLPIKPVVHGDGSGTTYYFSDYLSRVSPDWKLRFGAKTSLDWPAGFLSAKGSDGVARAVKATVGAIGYLDCNYVAEQGLATVQLRNASDEFVSPGAPGFKAAVRASDWYTKGDFHGSLSNLAGHGVWPITTGSFVLLPKVSDQPANTARALHFLLWSLLKGDTAVEGLSFVRLPDHIQALVFKTLSSVTDTHGKPLGFDALRAVSQP